jgi:hypothetical protein
MKRVVVIGRGDCDFAICVQSHKARKCWYPPGTFHKHQVVAQGRTCLLQPLLNIRKSRPQDAPLTPSIEPTSTNKGKLRHVRLPLLNHIPKIPKIPTLQQHPRRPRQRMAIELARLRPLRIRVRCSSGRRASLTRWARRQTHVYHCRYYERPGFDRY